MLAVRMGEGFWEAGLRVGQGGKWARAEEVGEKPQ